MKLKRRNFLHMTGLGLASVISGITLPSFTTRTFAQLPDTTKPLTINMPSADGKYAFWVDGQKQLITINNQTGKINIPLHSCFIEYTGADGSTKLSVYIDPNTSQSFLLPGSLSDEKEIEWNAVLLGNPVRGGKIVANITGPIDTKPVIEIIDLQGRTLVKEQVTKTRDVEGYEFDVQRFSKGILLLRVSCNTYTQTLKILNGI